MRVLVVEPSQAIRLALAARLRESGLEVVGETANLAETIDAIGRCAPDGILLELQLPDQKPLDTVRTVRAFAPSARIVVLSNATHYRVPALACGADHFLDKSKEFDATTHALLDVPMGAT